MNISSSESILKHKEMFYSNDTLQYIPEWCNGKCHPTCCKTHGYCWSTHRSPFYSQCAKNFSMQDS